MAEGITPLRPPADAQTVEQRLVALVNDEAEQALLGAVMIDNRAYDRVVELLRPSDFGNAVHGRIFEAIGQVIESGRNANPVTLKAVFDQDAALSEIGGAQYLARLATAAVTVINAADYAREIVELAHRRSIIAACRDAIEDAATVKLTRSSDDILSDFDRALIHLTEPSGNNWVPFEAATRRAVGQAEAVYKANGALIGITTGLTDLDRRLGGLHPGDLDIIASRPGMGKSALAMTIAHAAAWEGKRSIFFSLEMSAEQLAARQIAAECGISAEKQRAGPLDSVEMDRIIEASRRLEKLPIVINDDRMVTVSQMRARARRQKRRHGLDLVIVDYLQLMLADDTRSRRDDNRVQEISAITRAMKQLAGDLGVPVVVLSQLNRAVESREDKRPMLADLRDSGSIEQDADVVMFLYREEYYVSRAEPQRSANETEDHFNTRSSDWNEKLSEISGIADIMIAKNRHGSCRNVKVRFDAARTTFENLAFRAY